MIDYEVIACDGVAPVCGGQSLGRIGCGNVCVIPPIEGVAIGKNLFGSVGVMNGEVERDGGVTTVGVES